MHMKSDDGKFRIKDIFLNESQKKKKIVKGHFLHPLKIAYIVFISDTYSVKFSCQGRKIILQE